MIILHTNNIIMVAYKLYDNTITDTTNPIIGELKLEEDIVKDGVTETISAEFSYEIFLLPIIGNNANNTISQLINRLGDQIQNGKPCLEITKKIVEDNIENDEYTAVIFVKNKNYDDKASGTMQLYDWCSTNRKKRKINEKQMWINDLCRITENRQKISPIKALLQVFEMVTSKYVPEIPYIHLMVDKTNMDEANTLKNIYTKYGFELVNTRECNNKGYFTMKKLIKSQSNFLYKTGGIFTKKRKNKRKKNTCKYFINKKLRKYTAFW